MLCQSQWWFSSIILIYVHPISASILDNCVEVPWNSLSTIWNDLYLICMYIPRLRLVRGRRNGGVVLRSFALAMTLETPTLLPALGGVFSVGTFVHRRITHRGDSRLPSAPRCSLRVTHRCPENLPSNYRVRGIKLTFHEVRRGNYNSFPYLRLLISLSFSNIL